MIEDTHCFTKSASVFVKHKIDSLIEMMASIECPQSHLTTAFHSQLDEIEIASQLCGKEREALRQYCLSATSLELSLSRVHAQGRDKPFGYAGDFQIIDWTYTQYNGSLGRGKMWDEFYHLQVAPLAVCDRKNRFGDVLRAVASSTSRRPLHILNVASGPCRELIDGASRAEVSPRDLHVDCVDSDDKAIKYARTLLGDSWSSSVEFHHANALRYRPRRKYDLVWCAGLFDYLEHRLAASLARRLFNAVAPGGQLVIGNFSTDHQTRPWIEWCGNWLLCHRSETDFNQVAEDAGIPKSCRHQEVDRWNAIRFLYAAKIE